MTKTLREAILRGIWQTRSLALTRSVFTHRLVILRYHSVCGDRDRPDYVSTSISVPVSVFARQMDYISQHYACIPLDEAVACLNSRRAFPMRAVVITFDDGYRDNYQHAMPVLAQYRLPATIYLVSSTLTEARVLWTSRLRQVLAAARQDVLRVPDLHPDILSLRNDAARTISARTLTNILNQMPAAQRYESIEGIATTVGAPAAPPVERWFLTTEQIQEMRRHAITFGAHTVTHPNLPGIQADEARREIAQSRSQLESLLGVEIVNFSYPNSGSLYPHFDDQIVESVKQAGYRSAVTSLRGICAEVSDQYRLRRIGINRARSPLPTFSMLLERTRLLSASS